MITDFYTYYDGVRYGIEVGPIEGTGWIVINRKDGSAPDRFPVVGHRPSLALEVSDEIFSWIRRLWKEHTGVKLRRPPSSVLASGFKLRARDIAKEHFGTRDVDDVLTSASAAIERVKDGSPLAEDERAELIAALATLREIIGPRPVQRTAALPATGMEA